MSAIGVLAIDLAKNSFQVCGVRSDGVVVVNRAVSPGRLVQFLAKFGLVAPKVPIHLRLLQAALKGTEVDLPVPVREMGQIYVQQIDQLTDITMRLVNELEAATKCLPWSRLIALRRWQSRKSLARS